MDRQPNVAALVLNYGSYADTLECVAALEGQEYDACEIVVLDNASPDGSGPRLREALPHVRFIQNADNLGYAEGNNVGIRAAAESGAQYFFILNPDVRVGKGTLRRLVVELQSSPVRAGAMPLQVQEGDPGEMDPVVERGILGRLGIPRGALEEVEWLPLPKLFGAALLLSREAIEDVGCFDPIYFAYAEEEDLCRRLLYHGYELGMVPAARVVHKRDYASRDEPDGMAQLRRYLRRRNWMVLKLKHPRVPVAVSATVVAVRTLTRIVESALKLDRERLDLDLRIAKWLLKNYLRIVDSRRRDRNKTSGCI